MKKTVSLALILILVAAPLLRAAKYAGEPFALGAGARPLGMGNTYVALSDDASAVYYNPAGLALLMEKQGILLHSETFGSLLNHDFIAYATPTKLSGKPGALSLGIYRLGGGGILITEWDNDRQRPIIVSEKGHYDYLLLLGGGFAPGNRLRTGINAKIILRSLADYSGWGLGVDVGMQYDALQWATAGFSITSLTSSFISYDNGTKESITPAVRPGLYLHHVIVPFTLRFLADGEILFEGRKTAAQFWSGEASLDTHFGGEISYHDLFFARAGSDIGRLTIGVGLAFRNFRLDGAFLNHSDLDNSYRMSLKITL